MPEKIDNLFLPQLEYAVESVESAARRLRRVFDYFAFEYGYKNENDGYDKQIVLSPEDNPTYKRYIKQLRFVISDLECADAYLLEAQLPNGDLPDGIGPPKVKIDDKFMKELVTGFSEQCIVTGDPEDLRYKLFQCDCWLVFKRYLAYEKKAVEYLNSLSSTDVIRFFESFEEHWDITLVDPMDGSRTRYPGLKLNQFAHELMARGRQDGLDQKDYYGV